MPLPPLSRNLTVSADQDATSTAPVRVRRAASTKSRVAGNAAQHLLINIEGVLQLTLCDRSAILISGIKMMYELVKSIEQPLEIGAMNPVRQAYCELVKSIEVLDRDLQCVHQDLATAKIERASCAKYAECSASLSEQLNFIQFLQTWTVLCAVSIEMGDTVLNLKKTQRRFEVCANLAAKDSSRENFFKEKDKAKDQLMLVISEALNVHGRLIAECHQLLQQFRPRAEYSPPGRNFNNWNSKNNYAVCWNLMNWSLGTAFSSATTIFNQIEHAYRTEIGQGVDILGRDDPALRMSAHDFARLVTLVNQKINSYTLFASVCDLGTSSAALTEYWNGPEYQELRQNDVGIDEAEHHKEISLNFLSVLRYEKIYDRHLFNSIYDWRFQTAETILSYMAQGINFAEISDLIRDESIDQQLLNVDATIGEVRQMKESGIADSCVVGKLNEIYIRCVLFSMLIHYVHASSAAMKCHQRLATVEGSAAMSMSDAEALTKNLTIFYEHFSKAASVLSAELPPVRDSEVLDRINVGKRLVAECVKQGAGILSKTSVSLTNHLKGLDNSHNDDSPTHVNRLLEKLRYCRKKLEETTTTLRPVEGTAMWFEFECSLLEIGLFEIEQLWTRLRRGGHPDVSEIPAARAATIDLMMRERLRCDDLNKNLPLIFANSNMVASTDPGDTIAQNSTFENANASTKRNLLVFSQRIAFLQIQTLLALQPSVEIYSNMVRMHTLQVLHKARAFLDQNGPIDDTAMFETALQLFDDLMQALSDTRTVHAKIYKKFAQLLLVDEYRFVPGYLLSVERDIEFYSSQVLKRIVDDIDTCVPHAAGETQLASNEMAADARISQIDTMSLDEYFEVAKHDLCSIDQEPVHASPPTVIALQTLAKKNEERRARAMDMLAVANGWCELAEELFADNANPTYVRNFFNKAAVAREDAAAFLDLSNASLGMPSTTNRGNGSLDMSKLDSIQIRKQADDTRRRGELAFCRLVKATVYASDSALAYMLDNDEIQSIETSPRRSYNPIHPATGQPRLDLSGRPAINWVQELIIKLKPDEHRVPTRWVVHLHYPSRDAKYFTIAHSKAFADKNKGSASGKLKRGYVSHATAKRLLEWRASPI